MKFSRFLFAVVALAAIVAISVFVFRPKREDASKDDATPHHPVVNFIVAERKSTPSQLTLPAELQAFQDTPIHARTTGYIQKWFFDIGDRVNAGETLAVIESPEVDQELNQAKANLGQAEANLNLARISAERWKALGEQHAVAQQDVDTRVADFAARQADTRAAQANVDRLAQLKDYENVTAPYAGVISARNAQIGALISAGAGSEIYHIAQTDTLRVYVNVPQSYVRSISKGLAVDVLVPEFPSRKFEGTVARFAGSLDQNSRTLLVDIQIPNTSGELFPGMFCQVHFSLKATDPAIIIPSNAAMVRAEGPLAAVVNEKNRIHLAPLRLGRDFGTQIEVLEGLQPGEKIVSNPNDAFTEGLEVEPHAQKSDDKKVDQNAAVKDDDAQKKSEAEEQKDAKSSGPKEKPGEPQNK